MSAKVTPAAIVECVTDSYLATGRDMTVAEIAAALQQSATTIRRVINDAHGCPAGLATYHESRTSYERNYGFEAGSHRVWVYGPTRETLRARLINAR